MEQHSVDEELLLKQVLNLVMKHCLLSGRTSGQHKNRVIHFVHPLQLKVGKILSLLLSRLAYYECSRSGIGGSFISRWEAKKSRRSFVNYSTVL